MRRHGSSVVILSGRVVHKRLNEMVGSSTGSPESKDPLRSNGVGDINLVRIAEEKAVWLNAAIDVCLDLVLHARLHDQVLISLSSSLVNQTRDPAPGTRCLSSMGYANPTVLIRTNLSGDLNYTDRNIVEKLFQTFILRVGGISRGVERWVDLRRALGDCLPRQRQPST